MLPESILDVLVVGPDLMQARRKIESIAYISFHVYAMQFYCGTIC